MELDHILVKGAREHNLDIEALKIPKKKLVVFTGVSGSGKSSLAFDTLYAEGQRRYVESLSSYARQFLGQMDKPQVDQLRGLSPTIAIDQKAASANPRSTVGTITEIYDYLRVLYARVGVQHCPACDRVVESLSTDQVVARIQQIEGKVLLLAPLVVHRKGEHRELLEDRARRGFARARVDGVVCRLDEEIKLDKKRKHSVELVIDRLEPSTAPRSRLTDSVEQALEQGEGNLVVVPAEDPDVEPWRFSQHRYCTTCEISLPELSPQSFSFNSPLGMCPSCNGLGKTLEMDPELVIRDPRLSIRGGAIDPWASIMERGSGWSYSLFVGLRDTFGVDLDKPWQQLDPEHQTLVLYGAGNRRVQVHWKGKSGGGGSWQTRFEGVLNTLMRRYHETKSQQMREYYERFLSNRDCAACGGRRLRSEALAVRVGGCDLAEVAAMPVGGANRHFHELSLEGADALIATELLKEINARLDFLCAVGLDYLTLARPGPSLSGGEAQRIRLASQLGSELSGVMYVLDEPSIGLHQKDNRRLIETLQRLRDVGNSVLVVEHDQETIEAADYVIDFGPGAGRLGGKVVFHGTPAQLRRAGCLTGRYLGGKERIAIPETRRTSERSIRVLGARENNLADVDAAFPLGTLTAVTGVSGAGKSSLVTGILYPAIKRKLHGSTAQVGAHRAIEGLEQIDKIIHIDQSPIGRTPRSNPATYTKLFDEIRALFAQTPKARARGYKPGRFSFNVTGGRCQSCEGDGVKRVEMHFLSDVYVPCEVCKGRRYNEATLQVRYKGRNVADILDTSVEEGLELFSAHPRIRRILQTLADVGLDYIHLGQPAPTLSGGEAQRVKLSRELAKRSTGRTLYVLDEPTTGLHFDDIRKLLGVLERLVESGNTVVVIEHNLDVIKCADWVIDLGPAGGDAGGRIVCEGTPEQVAADTASATAAFLATALGGQTTGASRTKRKAKATTKGATAKRKAKATTKGATAKRNGTTAKRSGTTAKRSGTTAKRNGTTAKRNGPTVRSEVKTTTSGTKATRKRARPSVRA
ncbi:MAG: excinuclease ABC subunit A [Deltaproteobacteria bacterium]|nr:MAG: excinuclease ABC subunit A [Pseudomonadota bacterium]PIE66445.1 MAG: excinuclease ABC subunit A [Deltaproteobacteria bacterium]